MWFNNTKIKPHIFKSKKHTIGKVKKDNIHSKSLFISCGWKLSDKIGDNYYYYENGK